MIMTYSSTLKKGFALFVAILAIMLSAPQAFAESRGNAKFEKTTIDLGVIKDNKGPVSCDFKFTNTGDANLIIKRAKAECGCTSVSFPQNPVAPGKSSTISVKYSPIGHRGSFQKAITVWTNGKQGKLTLKIRGSVVPASEK